MMVELLGALGWTAATAVLVLLLGGAVVSCSTVGRALKGVELLAYSIGFGVLALAVLGVGVVSITFDYHRNATILLALATLFAAAQWYRTGVLARLFGRQGGEDSFRARLAAAGWVLMAVIPMLMTFAPVKMPAELPDGPYVIKNAHVHVKVQVMLGDFPADNYIPFVAAQYLLRDIPFSEVRPLMPGQELANRPILMSLAAIPLLAVLDPPPRHEGEMPTFRYVGKQWPDVGRFGDDRSFRRFLAVSLVLNATLLVGAALLLQHVGLRRGYWTAGLLVFMSSPYFIGQTLFSWPKSLAAFFVLLSAYTLIARHRTWVAGLMLVLAYWAHPYALVFMVAFAVFLLIRERNDPDPRRGLLPFALVCGVGLVLWWAWATWYLQISSDLVEQNLSVGAGLARHLYVRAINVINTFVPIIYSSSTWPSAAGLVQAAVLGLVGGVGVLLLPQALFAAIQCVRDRSSEFIILVMLPSALLIGVFSALAVPAVHGLQAIAVVLLAISLRWMQVRNMSRWMWSLVGGQIFLNIVVLVYRGHALVHG